MAHEAGGLTNQPDPYPTNLLSTHLFVSTIQVIIRVAEQASITEYPSVFVQIPRGSPSVLTIASDHSTLTFAGQTSQEGRRSLT